MRTRTSLSARELHRILAAATAWLERNASAINALNIFPVPDGDTGSNMVLSMRCALNEAGAVSENSVSAVAQAFARGALQGACGNSGVILSQFWKGLFWGLRDKRNAEVADLARGLLKSRELASAAVGQPVAGTILTVIDDIARCVEQGSVAGGNGELLPFMEGIVTAAGQSVANTPNLLPLLKEAGVVDAGGQGLYVILEGALAYLRGQVDPHSLPAFGSPATGEGSAGPEATRPAATGLAAAGEASTGPEATGELRPVTIGGERHRYGYCTEFLLQAPGLDLSEIRSFLQNKGQSVMVAGDGKTVRVHIHSGNPRAVIDWAETIGRVERVSIRDMDKQHEAYIKDRPGTGQEGKRSAVRIVTDSIADLSPEIVDRLGITVVPLTVSFGSETFRDGIDLSPDDFYARLKTSEHFPLTSVPSPAAFAEVYARLAEEAESILVITLSSRLSGTYDVARQSRRLTGKPCRIEVLDSGTAAMPEGFVVLKAAQAVRAGASLQEAKEVAANTIPRAQLLATFDTLEYLRRGGRIGAAKVLLGSVLRIHPLITVKAGLVAPAGRTHSRSKAVQRLVDFAAGYRSIEELAVEYTACHEEAEALLERLGELFPRERILTSRMTPVIGTHTGPGLLVVSILGDK
jgi:DAK2 domain fusion protein YloV